MRTVHVDALPEITTLPEGWWTLKVSPTTTLNPHPADHRYPRNERPLVHETGWTFQLLGLSLDSDDSVVCYTRDRGQHTVQGHYASYGVDYLMVATQPFVAVTRRREDNRPARCRAARQIHRGELGQYPVLRTLPPVWGSNIADPREPARTLNWVSLLDLSRITGFEPAAILRGFGIFSPSTYNDKANVPTLYHPALSKAKDIYRVYTEPKDEPGFCLGESEWGGDNAIPLGDLTEAQLIEQFVPLSFAHTVMRLSQFGYHPDVVLPKLVGMLQAPAPQMPSHQLPIKAEEDLTTLWLQLQSELPQGHFKRAAESALGLARDTTWSKAPASDDEGAMRYHVDFEQIEKQVEDGQVVVGTCFWTRGGHEPGEYYAGYLAVFPRGIEVTDARSDPRAILRLWFNPGEVMRQTPEGSRGGLCPSDVPAGCTTLVERLLLNLGYTI